MTRRGLLQLGSALGLSGAAFLTVGSGRVSAPAPSGGDDAAALRAALLSGDVTLRGAYRLAGEVVVPSNRKIGSAGDATVTWIGPDKSAAFFNADHAAQVSISGITFVGLSNEQVAVRSRGASDVTVAGCHMRNCRILETGGQGSPSYASVGPKDRARRITVSRNVAAGSDREVGEAAVALIFADGWTVTENTISTYHHGIQWWGGDSDFTADGALGNERKCTNGTIRANSVRDVGGGGIWGSMGRAITIGPDTVENCGDVGVDPEGCEDVVVTVGTVRGCTNGNLATFFGCTGVRFVGGNSIQDDPSHPHLRLNHNTTDDPAFNRDVTVDGLTMETTSGIGSAGHVGPAGVETIQNCNFRNTRLDLSGGTNAQLVVRDNRFVFDRKSAADFAAVYLGPVIRHGRKIVTGNVVHTAEPQPDGSMGIDSLDDDPRSSPQLLLESNQVSTGWTLPIHVRWTGRDPAFTLTATCRSNTAPSIEILSPGAGAPAAVVDEGNRSPDGGQLSVRTAEGTGQ